MSRNPSPGRKYGAPAAAGFTLLEVLVVLIVSGLIIGVVLQALSIVISGKEKLSETASSGAQIFSDVRRLTENLKGIVPTPRPDLPQFKGESRKLAAFTLNPLASTFGRPTGFTMEIVYDPETQQSSIQYSEGGKPPFPILSWPGREGHFEYAGVDRQWADQWFKVSRTEETPWLIHLSVPTNTFPDLVVALDGVHRRDVRPEDIPELLGAAPP